MSPLKCASSSRKTGITPVHGARKAWKPIQATIFAPLHPIDVIPQYVEVVS